MSEYKTVPRKHYNYYGCGSTKYDVYIKKSFLFVSWWSLLVTCDTIKHASTLIYNLLLLSENKNEGIRKLNEELDKKEV